MGDNTSLIRLDEAQALTQSLESAERSEEIGLSASGEAVGTITDEFIALIESRTFIRECIRRSMQSAFPLQIQTFSEADELQRKCHNLPNLILLSSIEERTEANADVFKISVSNSAQNTNHRPRPQQRRPNGHGRHLLRCKGLHPSNVGI